ncbi:hypothetical protein SAMN05443144_1097 [Fodinibius roseus]|uniref:Uncharacterized protein n=1 Tax=Fodinibius roseus TaxID=1194090 RepID=A0A1M5BVV5_9BACT|nr:hypothetical protein SAMN05443144_1097 [Fodinibius roseus]
MKVGENFRCKQLRGLWRVDSILLEIVPCTREYENFEKLCVSVLKNVESRRLHIKAKKHNIPILNDIVFAFLAHLTGIFYRFF